MRPKTLSASAASVFELCEARYKAEYIDRVPDMDGIAASLGTACHEALEHYVAGGWWGEPNLAQLLKFYDTAYFKVFSDREKYQEGVDLLTRWFESRDLRDGRSVLSTEKKETFLLVSKTGEEINFTYIWDRCDELPDGSIEVVDYKTVALPVQPEDLAKRIQPRAYALSAAIKYKNRDAYWVTYDLLRYDTVSKKFTRDDNIETYRYLQDLFDRILASDGSKETLNPECRFCVRKSSCDTLLRHSAGGGILGVSSLEEAADKRAQMEYSRAALDTAVKELDALILKMAEDQGVEEVRTNDTVLTITVGSRREIDHQMAQKVLPEDILARYAKLPMSAVDDLLKKKVLDPDVAAHLRALIRKKYTAPSIKTKPVAPVGDD